MPMWRCALKGFFLAVLTASADARLPLRLAVLYNAGTSPVPVQYLERTLNDSIASRTLLPDYDVVIDVIFYEAGHAAKTLVEALSTDDRKYAAIAGPIDNSDVEATIDLAPAARVLQVHESDAPHLSDRTRYPYSFRSWRSLDGQIAAWFNIVASNSWDSALGLWFSEGEVVSSSSFASMYNVSYHAYTIADQRNFVYGEDWMRNLVGVLRAERMRVVMVFLVENAARMLTCYVHRAPVTGLQYFVPGYYSPGWWVSDETPCTLDEAYLAVRGQVVVVHSPFPPGLNLFGALEVFAVNGDNTTENLTCSPDVTVGGFFTNGELLSAAAAAGLIQSMADATAFFGIAGVRYEHACAPLVGLHKAIYEKGFSLEQIENREPAAHKALVEAMEEVNFQGPTGPFRYYPGTGDPVIVLFLLAQYALEWKGNTSIVLSGYVDFPDGPRGEPNYTWIPDQELVWRDGSAGFGPHGNIGRFEDCSLQNGELWGDACRPCEKGTFFDSFIQACRTCAAGTFSNESGTSECRIAGTGHYILDTLDPRMETPCPPGHHCPQSSMTQPVRCTPGTFAIREGLASCSPCDHGSYQEEAASTACYDCGLTLGGGTTISMQATSPTECVCPAGQFLPAGASDCRSCPTGMVCPAGSDERNFPEGVIGGNASGIPLTARGYMTLVSKPLTVYACEVESQCPGGPPGTCAEHRDPHTVACGQCAEDSYASGSTCQPCGDNDGWPAALAIICAVLAIVAATIAMNRDARKTPAATLMIVIVSGLLFTSMQALGVFDQLDIPWEEPMTTLLRVIRFFSFDLRPLKLACVVGQSHVRSFALRQLVAVFVVPSVALTLFLKKHSPCFGRRKTRIFIELSNSVGTLFSVFFISILISAMDPLVCYEHPADNGESVRSAPSILCFEGADHVELVIIGVLALCLVPSPYLGMCCYGIWKYPRAIVKRDSKRFLTAMRFLFFRYNPSAYYFQVIILFRSLLLCLIPVVLRGRTAAQVIFMGLVLAAYVLIQEELRPWRASLCNTIDAAMTLMLLVILLCAALFMKGHLGESMVAVMSTAMLSALFVSAAAVLSIAVQRRFIPRPYYNYFICHHKASAGAQARYIKMLLLLKSRTIDVFIDSDNLQELDKLFDVVKSQTGCLIIYLTSDTLKRPWCAGEIVTAYRCGRRVAPIVTPSFKAPTPWQLKRIELFLDRFGCNLSEYNIQLADVAKAFQQLLGDLPMAISLDSTLYGSRRFEAAVAQLMRQKHSSEGALSEALGSGRAAGRSGALKGIAPGGLLVSTHHESDEANAAGAILVSVIYQDVFRLCEAGTSLVADYPDDEKAMVETARRARVVVVVLSAGSMRCSLQLAMICELMSIQDMQRAPGVISMNMYGFDFPDDYYFENVLHHVFAKEGFTSDSVKQLVRAFFKRISMVWPTHASQQALSAQAAVIYERARPFLKGGSTISTTWATDSSEQERPPLIAPGPSLASDEHWRNARRDVVLWQASV